MNHNTNSIGDLIKAFLKTRGLDEKMQEVDFAEKWEEIVGPMIANHTESIKLKGQILTLKLNSAALRHTLSYSKTDLILKLNEATGKELVKDVILK